MLKKLLKKEKTEEYLFFIAISPVNPLQNEIDSIKSAISQKYNTIGAFRSPAHITLQMPFKKKEHKMKELDKALRLFAMELEPFAIDLNGFGGFEPRVVFIKVEKNQTLDNLFLSLSKLLRQFQIFDSSYKSKGFHPHITVAFRDLKKSSFYPLLEEYRERDFSRKFTASGLTLYKHNGKKWESANFYPFKEN